MPRSSDPRSGQPGTATRKPDRAAQPDHPAQPEHGEVEAAVDGVAASVGALVRRHRIAAGLTLSELARRADLSVAFCSQIEAGRANPTLTALARVARSLDTSLAALMPAEPVGRAAGGPDGAAGSFAPTVRRTAGLPSPALSRVREWTAPGAGRLRALLLEGPEPPAGHPATHTGEELCVVLAGHYDLEIADQVETLRGGDAAHYPSSEAHRLQPGGPDAVALLVLGTP